MSDVLQIYLTASNIKASKYRKRQLQCARAAYDFIIKMGFIGFKAAAEVVQRGSITDLGFTRADLVNAQDIYGAPAAYQLGQGTQKSGDVRAVRILQCQTDEVCIPFKIGDTAKEVQLELWCGRLECRKWLRRRDMI
jgi:hypothetical protein